MTIVTGKTQRDGGQRFQVVFIMGADKAIIRDRAMTDGHGGFGELELPLGETVTEENFERIFFNISEALFRTGRPGPHDQAICTTFPEGSKIVQAGGAAYKSGCAESSKSVGLNAERKLT
jgi:hypothetical protein